MAQVVTGLPQDPFGETSFSLGETKSIPRVFALPCCSKGSELHPVLDAQEHRKAELVLLQAKKHDVHQLNKLSPYFKSCVSKGLL